MTCKALEVTLKLRGLRRGDEQVGGGEGRGGVSRGRGTPL